MRRPKKDVSIIPQTGIFFSARVKNAFIACKGLVSLDAQGVLFKIFLRAEI
jgi:hypothetical protein